MKRAQIGGPKPESGPEPEQGGAGDCRPADQRSAEPAIGPERTAFFPTFGEEERYRSFRADGYRLSRRLAGRRPAGRRRRAVQEGGTMKEATIGEDSKWHLPEGDAEQQTLLAEVPRDMAEQQSAMGPPARGARAHLPSGVGGKRSQPTREACRA